MSKFQECATWEDVPEAIRLARNGEATNFPLALKRYIAAPKPRHPGESALDVCCGVGQGALILRDHGYSPVWAVDHNDRARQLLIARGVAFYCSDVHAWQPGRTFDLITCCDALEHVPNPPDFLRRIATWLSDYGRLWLVVPLEKGSGCDPNPFHVNHFDAASLKTLLAGGWTIVQSNADKRPHAYDFQGLLMRKGG